MQRFIYKARDSKTGKMVKGAIQADSEMAAGKLLIEQGYTPDSITNADAGGFLDRFKNRVKTKDRIVFTRQFATLVGAGLPLAVSLKTVAEQTQNTAMKSIIEAILADVEAGKSLAESFQKYPEVFSKVYLALVKAGEASGTLDNALKNLAEQEEKDEAMMSKIRGALVYPGILLSVILAVLVFMIVVVVPQVQNLYNDLHKDLPFLTALLTAIANFVIGYWWVLIAVAVFIVWFIINFKRTEAGIKFFDRLKLNVPMFKKMFWRLYNARFAKTAQMLLATGVPMLESLKIASDSISNVILEEELISTREKVKAGKPLSEALKDKGYILPLVPQMASIGEQSGKVDEMLGKAAQVYSDELDEQVRTISTLIEPILLVIMAVLVGGIVGAVLFPIYALVSDVQMGLIWLF